MNLRKSEREYLRPTGQSTNKREKYKINFDLFLLPSESNLDRQVRGKKINPKTILLEDEKHFYYIKRSISDALLHMPHIQPKTIYYTYRRKNTI